MYTYEQTYFPRIPVEFYWAFRHSPGGRFGTRRVGPARKYAMIKVGQKTGLSFDARTVTIFDTGSSKALLSEANAGVLGNG